MLSAMAVSSCGLISADFEGDVRVKMGITDPENKYSDIEMLDPNDYEDYRNNKDKIKAGEVTGIEIRITQLNQDNLATLARGEVSVLRPGGNIESDADWINAIGEWQGVPLVINNVFRVNLAPERLAELNEILFADNGPITMRVIGVTDQGPVDFEFEVTVHIRFTAGV